MPLLKSTYKPSFLFKNHHFNTVYKTLFLKNTITYFRKRIKTPDADFIDLDFSTKKATTIVIVMHGLEGSSQSKYIIAAIEYLNTYAIDCVAVNFRGCSGEDNYKSYSYNSGKTNDLELVISYVLENYNYKNIFLLGFSMGGNIALKYMGETATIPFEIKGAIAISAPCDLKGSSEALANWYNSIYLNKFLKTLKSKSLLKLKTFPESNLNKEAIVNSKTFKDFDNAVTAPLFGYKNAEDYWKKCSSKQFIPNINKPTLLISAKDDSFLSKSCYPYKEATKNKHFFLETPNYGGHVGFNSFHFKKDTLWSEKRILQFIHRVIS